MENIPAHTLEQFRIFLGMLERQAQATTATSTLSGPATAPTPVPTQASTTQASVLQNSTLPNQPTSVSARLNPPIAPYQSLWQPRASSSSSTPGLLSSATINSAGTGTLYHDISSTSGLPANVPNPPHGRMGPGMGRVGTHFLGFQNRTGQANQDRLTAAFQNIPRPAPLPPHRQNNSQAPNSGAGSSTLSRRGRSRAIQPPHAQQQNSELSDILFSPSGQGDPSHSRIRAKVVPDPSEYAAGYFLYRFHRDSFNALLESYGLLFDLECPLDTPVTTILQDIQARMEGSRFQYSFNGVRSLASRLGTLPHESLPLSLLGLVNRGRTHPSLNEIQLRTEPAHNITIQRMLSDSSLRNRFVIPALCIEAGRLVINICISPRTQYSFRVPDEDNRRHHCLSQRIYREFPRDSLLERGRPANSDDDYNTSGGEDTRGMSDDEMSEVAIDLVPETPPRRSAPQMHVRPLQPSAPNPTALEAPTGELEVHLLTPAAGANAFSLPPTLWTTPWLEPATSGEINVENIESLRDAIFDQAQHPDRFENPPLFALAGSSTSHLAEKLVEAIKQALCDDNFEDVLSPNRDFAIMHTNQDGGLSREVLSLGEGIERESIYLAFDTYRKNSANWFIPQSDTYSTIATLQLLSPSFTYVSQTRLEALSVLGTLTGLMLVYGVAPTPLSPALIQFLLHGCNIHSLTPTFVQEWLPSLYRTLINWNEINASSNIEVFDPHYQLYHDFPVSCIQDRTEDLHRTLASEMLYRGAIGRALPSNREMAAFIRGFELNCRNGFKLTKLKSLIKGGSQAWITLVYSSLIGGYEDLEHLLSFPAAPLSLIGPLNAALRVLQDGDTPFHFFHLVTRFLKGKGIPCPRKFETSQAYFNNVAGLDKINDPGFCSRILCWAVTGTPTIDLTSTDRITLELCSDDDREYASVPSERRALIKEGTICFKTCVRLAKIPVSYIHALSTAAYPSADDPEVQTFYHAFDHWFLIQLLNAIGGHTII